MVVFEQFKLTELKDIIIYVRKKFNLFLGYKVYHTNKYDLINVMRNSTFFDETQPRYLYFSWSKRKRGKREDTEAPTFTAKFQPKPSTRYYKGPKTRGVKIRTFDKPIVVSFN